MSEEKTDEDRKKSGIGGIFIPAGIFLGMGIGFLLNNVVAGLFIGLGAGFAAFAVSLLLKR